jgi:hypothetical protein
VTLRAYGRPVAGVFDLLGHDENAMTAALGLALDRSSELRALILRDLGCRDDIARGDATIKLQSWRRDQGITDIEVTAGSSFFTVIEAKQGAWLPHADQLRLYAPVLKQSGIADRCLATLSDVPAALASETLPEAVDGESIRHLTWRRVLEHARSASTQESAVARRVLSELAHFLEEHLGMDTLYSNRAYVVSLGAGSPDGWPLSWIDIVAKHGRYFYPVGKRWPDPPNYLAVRYDGRLQSIHYVEGFSIFHDPSEVFPSVPSGRWEAHYLLTLGPAFGPTHEVRTGPRILRNNRCWCMLDTLLTCTTISDALTETERRLQAWEAARPA